MSTPVSLKAALVSAAVAAVTLAAGGPAAAQSAGSTATADATFAVRSESAVPRALPGHCAGATVRTYTQTGSTQRRTSAWGTSPST